jgi:hypothetical protein
VLCAEAAALLAMAETVGVGGGFLKAVHLMHDCRGQIGRPELSRSGWTNCSVGGPGTIVGLPADRA